MGHKGPALELPDKIFASRARGYRDRRGALDFADRQLALRTESCRAPVASHDEHGAQTTGLFRQPGALPVQQWPGQRPV